MLRLGTLAMTVVSGNVLDILAPKLQAAAVAASATPVGAGSRGKTYNDEEGNAKRRRHRHHNSVVGAAGDRHLLLDVSAFLETQVALRLLLLSTVGQFHFNLAVSWLPRLSRSRNYSTTHTLLLLLQVVGH